MNNLLEVFLWCITCGISKKEPVQQQQQQGQNLQHVGAMWRHLPPSQNNIPEQQEPNPFVTIQP